MEKVLLMHTLTSINQYWCYQFALKMDSPITLCKHPWLSALCPSPPSGIHSLSLCIALTLLICTRLEVAAVFFVFVYRFAFC